MTGLIGGRWVWEEEEELGCELFPLFDRPPPLVMYILLTPPIITFTPGLHAAIRPVASIVLLPPEIDVLYETIWETNLKKVFTGL